MANQNSGTLTKQQLYDRIRESSKEAYTLSEMIRLGYWKEEGGQPSLPAQLIEKETQLRKELNKLVTKQRIYQDPEKALKLLHQERKAKAKARREETKLKNNEARYQRAINWYTANQNDILFLGKEYSAGLVNGQSQMERLIKQGLPYFADISLLAKAMGISINELRFLSYGKKTSQINHYQQFLIAKKTGGTRRISAPMPRLKRAQYWILGNILEKASLHEQAHGFRAGHSIVTNAKPHVGKSVVINMDLQDFFPTIDYKRIKGLFVHLGYSEKIATIFALLCSEPERDTVALDNRIYHIARTPRHLPQGAPTSPSISNLICRRLDKRIAGTAKKLGFSYTRYADDLTFSYDKTDAPDAQKQAPVGKLLWRVKAIIQDEGFIVHPNKTRVMRQHQRQEVTGIVVNEKLSLNRANLKRFRALLFQIEKDGIAGKTWGNGNLLHAITGFANYVAMVNPEKGKPLQEKVQKIIQNVQNTQAPQTQSVIHKSPFNKTILRSKAVNGEAPIEDWWQAKAPDAPVKEQTSAEKKAIRQAKRQQTQNQSRQNQQNEYFEDEEDFYEIDDSDWIDTSAHSSENRRRFFAREAEIKKQ